MLLDTYTPYPTQIILAAGLEDHDVEPMPDTMRRGRHARDPRAYDRDLRPPEVRVRLRRPRREDYVDQPLPDLVQEEKRMEERVLDP